MSKKVNRKIHIKYKYQQRETIRFRILKKVNSGIESLKVYQRQLFWVVKKVMDRIQIVR